MNQHDELKLNQQLGRIEQSLQCLPSLTAKVDEMGRSLASLESVVNGGPGTTPMCLMHQSTVQSARDAVDVQNRRITELEGLNNGRFVELEKRASYYAGGIAVLSSLLILCNMFLGDIIKRKCGLDVPPHAHQGSKVVEVGIPTP